MPVVTETGTADSLAAYDLSLRLAPFRNASVRRTGDKSATVNIELDPRHAGLAIRLLPIGYDDAFVDSDTTVSGPAQVYAVVLAYDTGEEIPSLGTATEFSVSVDPSLSSEFVGIMGLEPDSTDDSGKPLESSVMYSVSSESTDDTATPGSDSFDSKEDDEVLPVDVVVRKKRIPVPPGTGHASSILLPLAGAFLAGVAVGAVIL